jgi:hypothetical protein
MTLINEPELPIPHGAIAGDWTSLTGVLAAFDGDDDSGGVVARPRQDPVSVLRVVVVRNSSPVGEVQITVPSENFLRYSLCSAVIRRTARARSYDDIGPIWAPPIE